MPRILFAMFCIALILTSLFAGVLGWYAVPVAVGVVIALACSLYVLARRSNQAEARIGDTLAVVMGTNNRWFAVVLCLFFLSFGIALYNGFGPPTLERFAEQKMLETGANRPGDIRQRILDRSVGQDPNKKAPQIVEQGNYNSWEAFWLRWLCVIVFMIITVLYLFISRSDEFATAIRKLSRRREGSSGQSWSEKLSEFVRAWRETRSTTTSGTTPSRSGGVLMKILGVDLTIEAIGAIMHQIFRKFNGR